MQTTKLYVGNLSYSVTESKLEEVFSAYGREIGLAYQLADDLVDLANGEILDSVILPLLSKIEKKQIKPGSLKDKEIRKIFAKNEDKIKEFYINEIKKHVKNAEKLSKSDLIPESGYKDLLSDFPRYIINEMLKEIGVAV